MDVYLYKINGNVFKLVCIAAVIKFVIETVGVQEEKKNL